MHKRQQQAQDGRKPLYAALLTIWNHWNLVGFPTYDLMNAYFCDLGVSSFWTIPFPLTTNSDKHGSEILWEEAYDQVEPGFGMRPKKNRDVNENTRSRTLYITQEFGIVMTISLRLQGDDGMIFFSISDGQNGARWIFLPNGTQNVQLARHGTGGTL